MARDPQLTLSDVQLVMGHAHLTTTELYLTPTRDEVIAGVLAHHARTGRAARGPGATAAGAGLRPAVAERAVREVDVTTTAKHVARKPLAVANAIEDPEQRRGTSSCANGFPPRQPEQCVA